MYKTNQVWFHSIMGLLLQLLRIPKNKRNKSHTENGQVKKDSKLESMMPSMNPRLLQGSLDQRDDQ